MSNCIVRPTMAALGLAAFARFADAQEPPPTRVVVTGAVYDSVARAPLANALVQVAPINDRAHAVTSVTNTSGEFHFDSLAPGTYLVGFLHPRLDSLLLTPSLQQLVVSASPSTRIALAIPSATTLMSKFCGETADPSSEVLMLGRVRLVDVSPSAVSTDSGVVRAEWTEFTTDTRRITTTPKSVLSRSLGDRGFALCGLPSDIGVTLRAELGGHSAPPLILDVPSDGVVVRDLWIRSRQSTATTALRGVVQQPTGAPISGARITMRGTDLRATTDSTGTFVLASAPSGTRMLDVRAIGFQPVRIIVDNVNDVPRPLRITLPATPNTLATVRVTARAWEAGLERRRQRHVASFLDDTTIARRDAMLMADVIRLMPGVRLEHPKTGFGDRILLGSPRRSCEPFVFVDGRRLENLTTGNLDVIVDPRDIRTIELYRYGHEVPFEFHAPTSCGAVMIWRK